MAYLQQIGSGQAQEENKIVNIDLRIFMIYQFKINIVRFIISQVNFFIVVLL